MKITTLEYIHELLQQDVQVHKKAVDLARTNKNKAEEEDADNLKTFEELYQKCWASLRKAENALQDFEEREW